VNPTKTRQTRQATENNGGFGRRRMEDTERILRGGGLGAGKLLARLYRVYNRRDWELTNWGRKETKDAP